jgi:hypothetical protein
MFQEKKSYKVKTNKQKQESHYQGFKMVWFLGWLLLYANRHRSILGAAGYIILAPANQLMVMGLEIWSLSNPGIKPATFRSQAYELTNCSNRAQIFF